MGKHRLRIWQVNCEVYRIFHPYWVCNCHDVSTNSDLSFHKYPNDSKLRKLSIDAIFSIFSKLRSKELRVTSDTKVYSQHFEDEDFKFADSWTRRLKVDGFCPSSFLWSVNKKLFHKAILFLVFRSRHENVWHGCHRAKLKWITRRGKNRGISSWVTENLYLWKRRQEKWNFKKIWSCSLGLFGMRQVHDVTCSQQLIDSFPFSSMQVKVVMKSWMLIPTPSV